MFHISRNKTLIVGYSACAEFNIGVSIKFNIQEKGYKDKGTVAFTFIIGRRNSTCSGRLLCVVMYGWKLQDNSIYGRVLRRILRLVNKFLRRVKSLVNLVAEFIQFSNRDRRKGFIKSTLEGCYLKRPLKH